MNKNTILIAISLMFVFQQTIYSQTKPFRFGLRVAPAIDWISPNSDGYENDGTAFGFNWGFMSDFALTDNYFLATGFGIQHLNGNLKFDYEQTLSGDTEPTTGELSRKYVLRYIDIPLMIKMKTNQFNDIQYFGQIGFGLGFNLKGTGKDTFQYTGGSTSSKTDISDDIALLRGSWALGGGLEYFIDGSTSLMLGLTFSNGITNILNGNNPVTGVKQKALPNYFELTIGIFF